MAGDPERSSGRKINILGKEISPEAIGLAGVFLTLAGVWAGNQPCLALPAIAVGLGMMGYGGGLKRL